MPKKLPLLLLPGLLSDKALWRHQTKSLESLAECRVVPPTEHDRMDALARGILAAAPPQFMLAAISMGGYVAFEIMRQAPERVLRLCLFDTSARADTPEQSKRRQLLIAMSHAGQFKGVTPRLLPTLLHPDHVEDKNLTDTIMAMAERVGAEAFRRQQTAIINRIDSRPSLKDIRCPTQVVVGREDAIAPVEVMREIADGIKGARFDIIENCGHLSPLEKPDEVTRIMKRWMEG
jgi:pimeloyl-ACP methyl ester carboxylesterase